MSDESPLPASARTVTRYTMTHFVGKISYEREVVLYAEVAALLTAWAEQEERYRSQVALITDGADETIAKLKAALAEAESETDTLNFVIGRLHAGLAEKETEIARLNAQLAERPA